MSHSPLPRPCHPDESICVDTKKILCEFIAETAAYTAFSALRDNFLSLLRSGPGFTDAIPLQHFQLLPEKKISTVK